MVNQNICSGKPSIPDCGRLLKTLDSL